jgi:hypothetical protein
LNALTHALAYSDCHTAVASFEKIFLIFPRLRLEVYYSRLESAVFVDTRLYLQALLLRRLLRLVVSHYFSSCDSFKKPQ